MPGKIAAAGAGKQAGAKGAGRAKARKTSKQVRTKESRARVPTTKQTRTRRAGRPGKSDRATKSVTMQARIDGEFARVLVEVDAAVLGLEGASDLVREGLRLLHRRAQEQEMIAGYTEFYNGQRAPLPVGVASDDD